MLLSETNLGNATDFSIPAQNKPYVLMVVGVNGVGKTTTIGKLASQFKKKGLKVVLGAADTFRAAAIDQLQVWADRVEIPMIRQEMGSDPASVAFDALESGVKQGADVNAKSNGMRPIRYAAKFNRVELIKIGNI